MGDVTQILSDIEGGDQGAAEKLLPLIYEELRRLAAQKMMGESPDHTLQATALVHEAYVRLVDVDEPQEWNGRGHFYSAAAEAMRRILVENARRKQAEKTGGDLNRVELSGNLVAGQVGTRNDILVLDEALERLEAVDPSKAQLIKLRFFGGLTHEEVAAVMGMSAVTAKRHWRYARSVLLRSMLSGGD